MNYTKEMEKEELIVKELCERYSGDTTRLIFELANHTVNRIEEREISNNNCRIKELIQGRNETNETILALYGSFFFNFYKNFPNVERQYLFRFIYLCTFMDYNNLLRFGNAKKDGNIMLKKDLKEVFKLSDNETRYTRDALIECGLIIINQDNSISINKDYCKKGKIDKRKLIGSIRMFNNSIKELYEKSKGIEHKNLALLIEILPYINYDYNVVCKNPTATEKDELIGITITELSKMLGYSKPQNLRKALFGVKVNEERVIMIAKFNDVDMAVINPRVLYKGNKLENMMGVAKLFDIAKLLSNGKNK